MTQNLQTEHFELLTDSGMTVVESSGHSDTVPRDGTVCVCGTVSGQSVEDSNGHSDTESTHGTL